MAWLVWAILFRAVYADLHERHLTAVDGPHEAGHDK
jgi:hypothetical protein